MACGVYISYRLGDQPWADKVCQSLENQGIPCRVAARDSMPNEGLPFPSPEGSLILILSSSHSPLPRQLLQELDGVRHSGLELRTLRADEVHTPAGLGEFLHDLKESGTLERHFSIPSQFLQAVPPGTPRQTALLPGTRIPKGYLEAAKSAPSHRRATPVLAAALVGILILGVWGYQTSSINLRPYEQSFAQQQQKARQVEAEHVRAQEALESAERYASQDRWREADEALTKAIAFDRGYAQAYFERGRARFWERDYVAAIEDFNAVIRLDPNLASGAITLRILAQQALAHPITFQ